jgi:hypothetical protein
LPQRRGSSKNVKQRRVYQSRTAWRQASMLDFRIFEIRDSVRHQPSRPCLCHRFASNQSPANPPAKTVVRITMAPMVTASARSPQSTSRSCEFCSSTVRSPSSGRNYSEAKDSAAVEGSNLRPAAHMSGSWGWLYKDATLHRRVNHSIGLKPGVVLPAVEMT